MRKIIASGLLFVFIASPALAQSWEVIQSRQNQLMITQQQQMLQQQRDEAFRQEQQRQVDRMRCGYGNLPSC